MSPAEIARDVIADVCPNRPFSNQSSDGGAESRAGPSEGAGPGAVAAMLGKHRDVVGRRRGNVDSANYDFN